MLLGSARKCTCRERSGEDSLGGFFFGRIGNGGGICRMVFRRFKRTWEVLDLMVVEPVKPCRASMAPVAFPVLWLRLAVVAMSLTMRALVTS